LTRRLVQSILRVWEDQRNSWIEVVWLLQKQIDEIQEGDYQGNALLKELADMLIIIIRYVDQLGLDYEKLVIHRLKTRHRGRVEAIKFKYALLWEKDVREGKI